MGISVAEVAKHVYDLKARVENIRRALSTAIVNHEERITALEQAVLNKPDDVTDE